MKIVIPSISKELSEEKIFNGINNNYSQLTNFWFDFQMEWLRGSYKRFNDHDKFLIVIYLVNKTLRFFSKNFIKLDYNSYYSKSQLEIADFNIINISKDLIISKETSRRKVLELEKAGVIIREKKKIILNRHPFKFKVPEKFIKKTAILLSKINNILYLNGEMNKKFSQETLELFINKNFSYCWQLFYEMQIPLVLNWKRHFGEFEIWHIWGIIVTQKSFKNNGHEKISLDRIKYLQSILSNNEKGINAMSISELTGIPRATVVRKLNNLLRKKLVVIDQKKLYYAGKNDAKKYIEINRKSISLLTTFFCKIINLVQTN